MAKTQSRPESAPAVVSEDVTIRELKRLKDQLALDIGTALANFEIKTGCAVEVIQIDGLELDAAKGDMSIQTMRKAVKITVRLPL